MPEVTQAQLLLAQRLKDLRRSWEGSPVTQRHIAEALGASAALVSSWESASAVPPEDRLKAYARFFATRRSMESEPAKLIPAEELAATEERRREQLVDELVALRDAAVQEDSAAPGRDRGALGGRFWYFSNGQPITILCTPMSLRQLGISNPEGRMPDEVREGDPLLAQYARNPSHPNPIYSLRNGDIDSLLELVGHIRAENPKATVRWRTFDRVQYADELSGNVVILGGGDGISSSDSGLVGEFTRSLDLPIVASSEPERDVEYGSRFTVRLNESGEPDPEGTREEIYRPRFLLEGEPSASKRQFKNGAPVLEYDIAAIVRRPNPYNGGATVTLCSGIFSRGTYGAVRVFTDEKLRQRNEDYLYNKLDPRDFWILIQVPVIMGGTRTTTPDIDRAFNRLRMSPPRTNL